MRPRRIRILYESSFTALNILELNDFIEIVEYTYYLLHKIICVVEKTNLVIVRTQK